MNILSYVHCFAFWTYLYLGIFVLWKNPRSGVNRACSGLMALFAFWSLGLIFVHNYNVSERTAWLSMSIYSVSWIGFASLYLVFTSILTKKEKLLKNPLFIFLAISVPLFFIYKQWTGYLIVSFVKTWYGWSTVWSRSIWLYVYSFYYFTAMILSLYFMYGFWKRAVKSNEKKQAIIISSCTLIVLISASVTDVLLPLLGIRSIPNIADAIALIWGVGLVVSVVKYKFGVLTPAMAAEDIISTMADSLVLISPESRILDVNRYTLDLLGYSKNEITGQHISLILADENSGYHFQEEAFSDLLKSSVIRDREMVYKTKFGDKIPISFSGSAMNDKDGNLVGIVGIARDMRQMNRLIEKEKELATAAAVTRAEHEKAEELERAYDDLKKTQTMLIQSEKLRALGQLGAGVAHELNSPLAGILCLMRSYMKKKDTGSEEYKDLREMIEGCEFMAKIIMDLSEFTKESTDRIKKINVKDVIESTLVLVTPQFKKNMIKIEKQYSDDIPLVQCERRQLQQIILNMATNARDAIGHDGVMKISVGKVVIDGKDYVEMKFEDDGCGMSDEIKKRIFEHFFTTKKDEKGIGLGLAIVDSIVRSYKGEILVDSEEGKGTVFIVRLPALPV